MQKSRTAVIHYMTGTGNTARAAGIIAAELEGAGWATSSAEIRTGAELPPGALQADLFVLCFPVLGFGMPTLVRRLVKGVEGRRLPAAAFATWGGEGAAALWLARLFLRRKGFRVIASGGATYPFQWTQVIPPPTGADMHGITEKGDAAACEFGKKLAAVFETSQQSVAMRPREIVPILLGLPVAFIYSWIGRSGLAAMYAADERCKACGRCEKDCPAGAIRMRGSGPQRRPQWLSTCQGCNRCINLCPRAAIQVSQVRAVVHLLLNAAVIVAMVVGLNRLAEAASLPAVVSVPAYAAALIALVVFGSRVQFSAVEPLLFALEGLSPMRRLLSRSWTARFPRYRSEGFEPGHAPREMD